ncbi:MAG TPA: DNA-formamidopyrimidine glycosylase family protein [Acidimicrobiales bacterium]
MPEGDTLHRVATRLRPALAGHTLVRFEAPLLRGPRPAPGDTIDEVEAQGKHLLVHFGGGLSLRTHLRMSGSWHLYRPGERWRRPRGQLRVAIEADSGWEAVCFAAPDVEVYRRRGAPPGAVARLGPDLCRPGAPVPEAVERLAALVPPETEVGVALLDQRVAAGIGNVYKSEVCFACGVDPFTPVGDVDGPLRERLYATAHRLLRANLDGGPRRTRADGLAVYGRAGRACPRCGTAVAVGRQGEHARVTYWCPGCQRRPGR